MIDNNHIVKGILYGLINGVMVVPVMISFCTIIYSDLFFRPFLPTLIKLTIFSAAFHQLSFTIFSSLPFAVGQVQDAGLIFLSAMSSNLVTYCRVHFNGDYTGEMDDSTSPLPKTTLATCVVLLACSTALLGIALIIVGKLKLASVVTYLPMNVIGGYLAYIGFFCGQAGLALMSGQQIKGIQDWGELWSTKSLILITPGIIFGLLMLIMVQRVRSMFTLPGCMFATIASFYIILSACGYSLDDAREYGWLQPKTETISFVDSWQYFNFDDVQWGGITKILVSWIGMFLVVSFSSSLDVAAIEMELSKPLDYNRELKTVGISNTISGLLGGYTGSYIFSQTIFNMRAKINSRYCGITIFVIELLMFFLPFQILAFVPKYFFGSLLILISVDLVIEWIWHARKKMMVSEYIGALATFVAIQWRGVEEGMLIGITLAIITFTLNYARIPALNKNSETSNMLLRERKSSLIRTFLERKLLDENKHLISAIELKGYIFFGSAVNLLNDIKTHLNIVNINDENDQIEDDQIISDDDNILMTDDENSFVPSTPVFNRGDSLNFRFNIEKIRSDHTAQLKLERIEEEEKQTRKKRKKNEKTPLLKDNNDNNNNNKDKNNDLGLFVDSLGLINNNKKKIKNKSKKKKKRTKDNKNYSSVSINDDNYDNLDNDEENNIINKNVEEKIKIKWLILDFKNVSGIDATAARACFLMLKQILILNDITLVFSSVKPNILTLLKAHGVIEDSDPLFKNLDLSLQYCEEALINSILSKKNYNNYYTKIRKKRINARPNFKKRREKFSRSLSTPIGDFSNNIINQVPFDSKIKIKINDPNIKKLLNLFQDYIDHQDDRILYQESFEDFELIISNYFEEIYFNKDDTIFKINESADNVYFLLSGIVEVQKEIDNKIKKLTFTHGGLFGELAFILNRDHSSTAICKSDCHLYKLSRRFFRKMQKNHSKVALLIQHIVLRSVSLTISSRPI